MSIIDEWFRAEAEDCFYGEESEGNKEVSVIHTGDEVAVNLEVDGEPLGLYFSRVQAARLAALLDAVSRQPTVAESRASAPAGEER